MLNIMLFHRCFFFCRSNNVDDSITNKKVPAPRSKLPPTFRIVTTAQTQNGVARTRLARARSIVDPCTINRNIPPLRIPPIPNTTAERMINNKRAGIPEGRAIIILLMLFCYLLLTDLPYFIVALGHNFFLSVLCQQFFFNCHQTMSGKTKARKRKPE